MLLQFILSRPCNIVRRLEVRATRAFLYRLAFVNALNSNNLQISSPNVMFTLPTLLRFASHDDSAPYLVLACRTPV